MPLCNSQMFLPIFGHAAVHSLPSAPAADGIKFYLNFYPETSRWNEWKGEAVGQCQKKPLKSNPRQRLSSPGIRNQTVLNNCWSPRPPLTFNQLSQQGRPAGMHESWQRQACSSEISPLKYSGSSLTFQTGETSTRLIRGWDAAEEQWHPIKGCNYAI